MYDVAMRLSVNGTPYNSIETKDEEQILRSAVSRACDKGEYRNQKTQERDQQIAPFVLPQLYKTAPECERVSPHQRNIYRQRLLATLNCVLDHLPKPGISDLALCMTVSRIW
jgi:hypothetical protein